MDYTNFPAYFDDTKSYVLDELSHRMQINIKTSANPKILKEALMEAELQIFQDGSRGAPKAPEMLSIQNKIASQLDEYIDSHSDANGNLWPVDVIRDESDLNDIKVCDYRHALVYLYQQALKEE